MGALLVALCAVSKNCKGAEPTVAWVAVEGTITQWCRSLELMCLALHVCGSRTLIDAQSCTSMGCLHRCTWPCAHGLFALMCLVCACMHALFELMPGPAQVRGVALMLVLAAIHMCASCSRALSSLNAPPPGRAMRRLALVVQFFFFFLEKPGAETCFPTQIIAACRKFCSGVMYNA
ncbi:hypothetical protein DUNSADRAFT_17871 [Dunaliella salina]|uniref:Encoded protein n=1 Tax=Dunaliella salina TaxID=3046 RepID=A0ABQ7G0Y7_DUNSA|nr:hypothetical protein DUNSADRAFT_17871 [Dunaliella salina]|eukprot:KAF5828263.1 hypothetical protein DUNSADRAFT_17871 [Dunaliella salina]